METTVLHSTDKMDPQEHLLDLRGLLNPEPIIELALAAQYWREGERVRVLSDDGCFASDFVRWAGGSDVQILSLRYPRENLTEVILRRPARLAHRISA